MKSLALAHDTGLNLVCFVDLPVGSSFRWAIPPTFRGATLDGIYVKGSARTFGDHECQAFEINDRELNTLVRPL